MATIEKRGKGYRITVAAGIDMNGKQIRHRLVWTPDEKMTPRQIEKELNRQAVRFEEQVKNGSAALGGNIKFADFAKRYFEEYGKLYLKPTTLANYENNLTRINQAMGHLRLKDLTPLHIQAFYRNLQEEGIRQRSTATAEPALLEWYRSRDCSRTALASRIGISHQTLGVALRGGTVSLDTAKKIAATAELPIGQLFHVTTDVTPLSAATLHSYHRTLSSIFEKAIRWQCISSNPTERAELPSLAGHKANYLDEPEARKMLQLLQAEPIKWRAPIIFDLLSGLRRAELLGLRWRDVDFDTEVIHIEQTSNYVSGKGVYTSSPKTEGSDRHLKVSRSALSILLEYKAWQDEMRSCVGDAWEGAEDDDRIFTSEFGKPLFPASLTKWMSAFAERSGLPKSTVHSLRHPNVKLKPNIF